MKQQNPIRRIVNWCCKKEKKDFGKMDEKRKARKRIKACPRENSVEDFVKIEIEDEATLEQVSENLDAYILECKKGSDIVLDVYDGLMFYKKKEKKE